MQMKITNYGPYDMWVRPKSECVQRVFDKGDRGTRIPPNASHVYDPEKEDILSFDGSSDHKMEEV